jgi:UDP-GlcNAc:undecaprenyl-phosphate GlcNAc-1-phosphate transferase
MLTNFFISVAISFFLSFIITPLVRNFLVSKNLVEDPVKKQQKTHNATATAHLPRGGGVPIFIGIIAASALLLPLDRQLISIFIAMSLTLIVGLFDDIYDISPKLRLATNIVAALVVVGSGIGIAYISNPLGGVFDLSFIRIEFDLFGPHSIWVISDIIAVIWIVWCMNITGWSGGVEGQLPGFVGISAIFIGLLGLKFSQDIQQWPVIILAGAVAGAYLGFLPFNFNPQTIMPGYSAKSLAGFSLGVLSILSGAKLATLFLLLAIPMLDAIFVLVRRLSQGRSLVKSDGQHLHHLLLRLGWSRQKIAILYWMVSLGLGLATLLLNTQQKLFVLVLVVVLFAITLSKIYQRI